MKSIRSRLIVLIVSILLLVLLCQTIFYNFCATPYYIYKKTQILKSMFYEIEESYNGDISTIENKFAKEFDNNSLHVLIGENNKKTNTYRVFSYPNFPAVAISPSTEAKNSFQNKNNKKNILNSVECDVIYEYVVTPKYQQKIDTAKHPKNYKTISEQPFIFITNKEDNDKLILLQSFDYNNDISVDVQISIVVGSIENSVKILGDASIIISVIIFCIGALLVFYISKKLTTPILKIKNVATNVANLNFDTKADENTKICELDTLAKSINTMSTQLNNMISELQNANYKLKNDIVYQKNLDKSRMEFLSNVSHELKTPIQMLMLYSENLKYNIDSIDREYYCDTIIEELHSMSKMVNELLNICRLEKNLQNIDKVNIDLSALCEYIVAKFHIWLKDYELNINIEKDIMVYGNNNFLEQAIRNYISNAVAHTQKGKKININLYSNESTAFVTVENEGEHIAEDDIKLIWDSFYQTEKAHTNDEFHNYGLGLSVVKSIIDAHNGKYYADNTDIGVRFTIELNKIL